ncbi:uncharacterized protein LOC120531135 [Polypterus senegalus]|uniref:uncharacterized protein LOC120531135 n=1 Tax=Polypterus senegalus TaxID=55291 RepID=UPI001964F1DA|nr:uncharacterized protein LOC120531135 [Polypterus senegalus]XP_039612200.1 uncharacterized protein LOC120531135 [Polypterus senegalus]
MKQIAEVDCLIGRRRMTVQASATRYLLKECICLAHLGYGVEDQGARGSSKANRSMELTRTITRCGPSNGNYYSDTSTLRKFHSDPAVIICGDFSHVTLEGTMTNFHQFVTGSTRGNNKLDLLYSNVKDAFKYNLLAPLFKSDCNLIHLIPSYKRVIRQQPVTNKIVRKWSLEAEMFPNDCFQMTDWEMMCVSHGDDTVALCH